MQNDGVVQSECRRPECLGRCQRTFVVTVVVLFCKNRRSGNIVVSFVCGLGASLVYPVVDLYSANVTKNTNPEKKLKFRRLNCAPLTHASIL